MSLNPKVGDTLWCVMSYRKIPHYVTVRKVGSTWITFDGGRCDVNGRIDGGNFGSSGKCYPNKAAYEAELELAVEWRTFRRRVDREVRVPAGVALQAIQQVNKLLFGDAGTAHAEAQLVGTRSDK